MGRPSKNYCDYFSHDSGMRNHKKVRALRSKFGITGYAVWCMMLEYLTGSDGNVFKYDEIEFEFMSGDFGVSVTEIRDTVDYCIRMELLFLKDGFVNSDSLDERLAPVYEKRGVAKERSAQQLRINGKFANNNADAVGVSVTEIPQSKVNESKVNEKKLKVVAPGAPDIPFDGDVLVSWNEWMEHLKQKKKKPTPLAIQKQIKFLGGRPRDEIIAIINQSITNNYQGLFELKNYVRVKEAVRTVDAVIEQPRDYGTKKGF